MTKYSVEQILTNAADRWPTAVTLVRIQMVVTSADASKVLNWKTVATVALVSSDYNLGLQLNFEATTERI